jgi:hypothetical protein
VTVADQESALRSSIQAAYIEVQKTKIDRTFRAADFVTKSAGTIATVYTGLLALVYSVAANPPRPLPARGVAPAIFLALAFFFSVVNVGFLRRAGQRVDILADADSWEKQQARLINYLQWIDRGALKRAWALRIGIVCLGAGVALLPLPFVGISLTQTRVAIGVAIGVLLVWMIWEVVASLWNRRFPEQPVEAPVPDPELL